MRLTRTTVSALAVASLRGAAAASLSRRQQPDASSTDAWPYAPLEWGDLNIIATSDSHGWLLGHTKSSYPEPNYSADAGDTLSFITQLKHRAIMRGADLLMVDSGDLHDGNGLSDVIEPGGVGGTHSNRFLLGLPYDVMTIGNHELYNHTITLDMHQNFAPKLKGRYLTSNVNITVPGMQESVPVGNRFAKFKTMQGRKVMAYGVLFSFKGNPAGTIVQPVPEMVQEAWFQESLQDPEEADVFLLVGHQPLREDANEWPTVIAAIRAVHPTTPILVFGGHSHIRDCVVFEPRAVGLQAGRYMETLGWLSINFNEPGSTTPLQFSRRYLDTNRNTYKYHTQSTLFDTPSGKKMTRELTKTAGAFNLSTVFGWVPQDYYLDRVAYPHPQSVVTLLIQDVLPTVLKGVEPSRVGKPFMVVSNSGALRFDLLQGPFTKGDQYIVSPFSDYFLHVRDVPVRLARQLEEALNESGLPAFTDDEGVWRQTEASVHATYDAWRRNMWSNYERILQPVQDAGPQWSASSPPIPSDRTIGYVTSDSCPGNGDDTLHVPVPVLDNPPFVGSPIPAGLADDAVIDVVMPRFTHRQGITVLNQLAGEPIYDYSDALPYGKVQQQEVFGLYAAKAWSK